MGLFNCTKNPVSTPPWSLQKKVLDGVILVLAWALNPARQQERHEQALEQGMVGVDTVPETLEIQSRTLTPREGEERRI